MKGCGLVRFWPKSNFSKLHVFIAAFTLLSVLTGLSLNYGLIPGYTIRTLHFYSGVLMVVAPLVVLTFLKKRHQTMNAFKTLAFVNSMDIRRKRYLAITAKILLNIFVLGLLKQLLTGLAIQLQIFDTPDMVNGLYNAHSFGIMLLPVLLVLHVVLMIIVKKATRPR